MVGNGETVWMAKQKTFTVCLPGARFLTPGQGHRHGIRGLALFGTVCFLSTEALWKDSPPILTKDDQPPLSSSWLSVEENNTTISTTKATRREVNAAVPSGAFPQHSPVPGLHLTLCVAYLGDDVSISTRMSTGGARCTRWQRWASTFHMYKNHLRGL